MIFQRSTRDRRASATLGVATVLVGTAVALVLVMFVYSEWNANSWTSNPGNVLSFRTSISPPNGQTIRTASAPAALKSLLLSTYPDELHAVTYFERVEVQLVSPSNPINRHTVKLLVVDKDFFKVFTDLALDSQTERPQPGSFYLSTSVARSLESSRQSAFEWMVSIVGEDAPFAVAGIFTAPKSNASVQFDAVQVVDAHAGAQKTGLGAWFSLSGYVFARVDDESAVSAIAPNEHLDTWLPKPAPELMPSQLLHIRTTRLTNLFAEPGVRGELSARKPVGYLSIVATTAMLVTIAMIVNALPLFAEWFSTKQTEFFVRNVAGVRRYKLVLGLLMKLAFILVVVALVTLVIYRVLLLYSPDLALVGIVLPSINWTSWATVIVLGSVLFLALSITVIRFVGREIGFERQAEAPWVSNFVAAVVLFVQTAIAVYFIANAAYTLKTYKELVNVDRGYELTNLHLVSDLAKNKNMSAEGLERISDEISNLPGITAGYSNFLPTSGTPATGVATVVNGGSDIPLAVITGRNIAQLMELRLLEGAFPRPRTDVNETGSQLVAGLLTERSVHTFNFSRLIDAINKEVRLRVGGNQVAVRIVGVVADIRPGHPFEEVVPTIMTELPYGANHLLIRAEEGIDITEVVRLLRRRFDDSALSVTSATNMAANQLRDLYIMSTLLTMAAFTAVVMFALGVRSVLATSIRSHWHEAVLLNAFGCHERQIARTLVTPTVGATLLGILAGLGLLVAIPSPSEVVAKSLDATRWLFPSIIVTAVTLYVMAVACHQVRDIRRLSVANALLQVEEPW